MLPAPVGCAGAARVDSCQALGEAAADTLHSQSARVLPPRGALLCPLLSPGKRVREVWRPLCSRASPWTLLGSSERWPPSVALLLPLKQGPPRSLRAWHGCVCPFALLLLYPLAPLPRKGSRERLQLSLCSTEPVQFACIAAMIAGFHQMRGASFLIACVISSRGTHCIKSLIQRAAKGARSGSVRLLLISYTTLTLPPGLYPSQRLELAQPAPLEGSRGGKGCLAPPLSPIPCSGYSARISWGLRRVE